MTLVFPDQIIDYTYSRTHTYHTRDSGRVNHVDFTYPYDDSIRQQLMHSAQELGIDHVDHGVYGATQGPRLETAAEIRRLRQDGCDMVGMTGMPEAVLARELELKYATCGLVVNWAAGIEERVISMAEILANVEQWMQKVKRLLLAVARLVPA